MAYTSEQIKTWTDDYLTKNPGDYKGVHSAMQTYGVTGAQMDTAYGNAAGTVDKYVTDQGWNAPAPAPAPPPPPVNPPAAAPPPGNPNYTSDVIKNWTDGYLAGNPGDYAGVHAVAKELGITGAQIDTAYGNTPGAVDQYTQANGLGLLDGTPTAGAFANYTKPAATAGATGTNAPPTALTLSPTMAPEEIKAGVDSYLAANPGNYRGVYDAMQTAGVTAAQIDTAYGNTPGTVGAYTEAQGWNAPAPAPNNVTDTTGPVAPPTLGADRLVEARTLEIMNSNHPFIVKARMDAMKAAAARGLQNSSIAAEMGQAAAMEAARAIASEDAGILANSDLAYQNYLQNRESTQLAGAVSGGLNDQNAAAEMARLEYSTNAQATMEATKAAAQEKLSQMDVDARTLTAISGAVDGMGQQYTAQYSAILQSDEFATPADRKAALDDLSDAFQNNVDLVTSLYGIGVTWNLPNGTLANQAATVSGGTQDSPGLLDEPAGVTTNNPPDFNGTPSTGQTFQEFRG